MELANAFSQRRAVHVPALAVNQTSLQESPGGSREGVRIAFSRSREHQLA